MSESSGHLCPRCGKALRRIPRLRRHRLLSWVYPLARYGCEAGCGFSELRRAHPHPQRRQRQIRTALLIVLLAVVAAAVLHFLTPSGRPMAPDDETVTVG